MIIAAPAYIGMISASVTGYPLRQPHSVPVLYLRYLRRIIDIKIVSLQTLLDGFPYPVDREVYDNSIQTIRDAIDQARIKKDTKLKAIKRLDDFIS